MRSKIKLVCPSGEAQCKANSNSGAQSGGLQERQQPSVNTEGQRSAEPTETSMEHGRPSTVSCGCEHSRQVAEGPEAGSLCQELFLVCKFKKFGDIPGLGNVYVETVVDCASGVAFAKVYSEKSAMNAVDILRIRAVPYFQRHGSTVTAVHTPRSREYCGLSPIHPFEAFLSSSHIRHLSLDDACPCCRHRCERFYRLLHEDFFIPALRRNFPLSLSSLQQDLDDFVESHNARQPDNEYQSQGNSGPSANSSVHP